MFSSLASFIFGSNTSATTNRSEVNQNPQEQQQRDHDNHHHQQAVHCVDAENTIEVTSSTPSVTGTRRGGKPNKRNKHKRQGHGQVQGQGHSNAAGRASQGHAKDTKQQQPTLTQLLLTAKNEGGVDEISDDDDWFIVEKEDDEDESLPRTDSEGELPQRGKRSGNNNGRVATSTDSATATVSHQSVSSTSASAISGRPNINAHSLYNGPRPQQQRNYLQRARNAPSSSRSGPLNVSSLSPPRSVGAAVAADAGINGGGITQSLYVVTSGRDGSNGSSGSGSGANPTSMEESWFVTPPPCFTSIGPIHMETSPFENLLIEHPSMSVYHSIRSAQEATESFVNLDLGVEESQQQQQQQQQQQHGMPSTPRAASARGDRSGSVVVTTTNGRNTRAVHARTNNVRVDRFAIAQLKQELLAHQAQKSHDKKERKSLRRGAIKRANKTRDYQGKGQRQRRADMQHCKIISGANNNRKSHF